MNLKKVRVLLFVVVLAFSVVSCQSNKNVEDGNKSNQEGIKEEGINGGEINVPVIHVKALNPLLNSSSSVYYFNKLIFEGLFEFDEKLEPKEQLVENYKLNPDNSIDISLKKNIKWHDGQELKTSDVKFTIDTIKYAALNNKYLDLISDVYKPEGVLDTNNISDVVVKDDYNMTIYFSGETNNILEMLTFPIIAAHTFNDDYERALATENYKPIGTGPYKQAKYEKLKFIELEASDKYWGEKPYIKRIKGRILKDEGLSLTSFESGQIDLTFSLETDWEKYSQDEKVKIHEFPSRRYEFLAINSKSKVFEGEAGNAIRKAIAYGINREKIIDRVYLGHATKTNTPINPKSYLTNKDINSKYEYSVKKAKDILEDAGFKDENNDGMYEDEKGNEISIKLTTNSYNDLRVRTLEMISEDLKSIGINVEKDYEVIDTEGIEEEQKQTQWDRFESKISTGKFEVALLGWETSLMQDISFMFHSSEIIGKNNFINYENLKLDKALNDIKSSITKEDKKNNYIKAQKIITDELPYISLFFTNGAVLNNKKINGKIEPNYTNIYSNIEEWFIPEKYQSQTD